MRKSLFLSALVLPFLSCSATAKSLSTPTEISISGKFRVKDVLEPSGEAIVQLHLNAKDSPLKDPRGLEIRLLTYKKTVIRDGTSYTDVLSLEEFTDFEAVNDFNGVSGRFYHLKFKRGFVALQPEAGQSPTEIVLDMGAKKIYFQVLSTVAEEQAWNGFSYVFKSHKRPSFIDAVKRTCEWFLEGLSSLTPRKN